MTDQDDIRPWDRQPGESSKAYEAFVTYRDLGHDRTVPKVAGQLGKSQALMTRWSSQHNWVSRSSAWDSLPGRAVEEAYADRAARIAEQHDRLASKLLERLERNLELMPEGTDPSIKWSTAHGAARQGHSLAADLTKPTSQNSQAITDAIENLLNKLAGEE